MNRLRSLASVQSTTSWDVLVIGGGATGLSCALDAASRGYKTLLVEKFDFAKGTSSRSTKLVHGGVRYLAQGNIRLVREALHERGRLLKNAPHVCSSVAFVMPFYTLWQKWYYGAGLWLYELLSGKWSLGPTKFLSVNGTKRNLPGLSADHLKGGILYFDGQFDDARLAINMAQTAEEQGATVINYMQVISFIKINNTITGARIYDSINDTCYDITAKAVINATGVFADDLLQLAEHKNTTTITPSQGIHLVIDKHFFEGDAALMIPKTDDGRVLFAVPWHNKILIGTTDTLMENISTEPTALKSEIDFVISHFNRYAVSAIHHRDIRSVFAGLRPLVKTNSNKKTSVMPRDHQVDVLPSGLIHVTGGKWTTCRSMAEHAINKAAEYAKLAPSQCCTGNLRIHGWQQLNNDTDHLCVYGADAVHIKKLMQEDNSFTALLHKGHPYTKAEIIWVIRNEMAMTIEDVLSRRIRLLFLDAAAAIEAAPAVAGWMAEEMNKNESWKAEQLKQFINLANAYLLKT